MPLEQLNCWHHPTGFGILGYALPAAIGGAIARPDVPMVVIAGDAGVQYTMQGLPLVAEMNLNLVLLLWNNNRFEQLSDDMQAAGISQLGAQKNPDFAPLTRACGWHYECVGQLDSLDACLQQVFAGDIRPLLLQINEYELIDN